MECKELITTSKEYQRHKIPHAMCPYDGKAYSKEEIDAMMEALSKVVALPMEITMNSFPAIAEEMYQLKMVISRNKAVLGSTGSGKTTWVRRYAALTHPHRSKTFILGLQEDWEPFSAEPANMGIEYVLFSDNDSRCNDTLIMQSLTKIMPPIELSDNLPALVIVDLPESMLGLREQTPTELGKFVWFVSETAGIWNREIVTTIQDSPIRPGNNEALLMNCPMSIRPVLDCKPIIAEIQLESGTMFITE